MAIQTTVGGLDVPVAKSMIAALNETMLRAAEPLIAEALKKIEQEMRAALSARLISMIDQNVDVFRDRRDLVVRIRQENGNG